MSYKYVAYKEDGTVLKGTVDATTEGLAKESIQRSGYKLLSLKATRPALSIQRSLPTIFGVKANDVIAFSRQLATMVGRGITTLSALQLLRDQVRNIVFKDVITAMIQDLQQGSSLAEAISRHPHAFPPIYSRMIRMSEQTGNLEVVLRQIASYLEKQKAVLKKASKAMIYPAFLLLLASGLVTILVTFTLPPVIELFADFEAELPLVTKVLLVIVGFVTTYKFYLGAVIIGIAALVVWYVIRPASHQSLDRLLLKIPLIGSIITLREISYFSRTMSMSINVGLPMPETMDLVIQTSRNVVVREALEDMRRGILEGHGISGSMAASKLFPPFMVQVVKVGEQVGTISEDLMVVADSYEQEVDEKVNNLMSMLQPCLLLVIGLILGFIGVSIIMPIYSIMGSLG